MYHRAHFKEEDRARIVEFMRANSFVTLIGRDAAGRIEATQIPAIVEERGDRLWICGHVVRGSSHQRALEVHPEALMIFTGPHTYVSATWYPNPQQASTWNYMSVHARGKVRFLDENGLAELLGKLSLHFENGNRQSPTVFGNLPVEYREKLMKAIIALEMEVTELENVFKLSQNREEASYDAVVEKLEGQDEAGRAIAREMRRKRGEVFEGE
jgi:transcriptional regulator